MNLSQKLQTLWDKYEECVKTPGLSVKQQRAIYKCFLKASEDLFRIEHEAEEQWIRMMKARGLW